MIVDNFTTKLNCIEGKVYTIEEEVRLVDGRYKAFLKHDNVNSQSVNVYSGSKLTGEKINNIILSIPSEEHWKTEIEIFSNYETVYITYETIGDTVEAEDINVLQDSLVKAQTEINEFQSHVNAELLNRYTRDKVFTKEEVLSEIEKLINNAPDVLDTFAEISKALGNDPNFANTMTTMLSKKVDKVNGKQLSDENYTLVEKSKLANIQNNANNYSHPSTHDASMITGLSNVAKSGSYNDLIDKPTSMTANGGHSNTTDKFKVARAINGVLFDGTSNITIADNTKVEPSGTIVANRVPVFSDTTGKIIKDSGFTIASSVPSNAKFTDTIYSHPSTHDVSMITGLSSVAKSGDYNDLSNKPTSLPANGGNSNTVGGKNPSDFAPSGFGLGTICTLISDWNNATKNGWYMSSNIDLPLNVPTVNTWYMGYVIAHNDKYIIQRVCAFSTTGIWYERRCNNGSWNPWIELKFTDTNTWRGIQDNLTSSATNQSLSANQGKILKGLVDGKASSNHTHSSIISTNLGGQALSLDSLTLSEGSPHIAYYFCNSDGGGSDITGRPDDGRKYAFNLKVELLRYANPTDYITKQTYTIGADKTTYIRYGVNGSWSSWEKVYTSIKKPTLAELGASHVNHTHTKSQITDFPTKLSQFEDDLGVGGLPPYFTWDMLKGV